MRWTSASSALTRTLTFSRVLFTQTAWWQELASSVLLAQQMLIVQEAACRDGHLLPPNILSFRNVQKNYIERGFPRITSDYQGCDRLQTVFTGEFCNSSFRAADDHIKMMGKE